MEVFCCEVGDQYAGGVPLSDKSVVEFRSGLAQGQQLLGAAILLEENPCRTRAP